MSRPLRIELIDGFYHVMNRGRSRQRIFHGDDYYICFLNVLSEACQRFGMEVHAYCLMSNHYHLLLKTPEGNLSRCMRHVNGVYTQRYNRIRKTDGALFRGRYKALLVDSDAYLLHLSKYIHRNPLQAKMVDSLEDYRWSSYAAYVGLQQVPAWLNCKATYGQLNVSGDEDQAYRRFMNETTANREVADFYARKRQSPILGDDEFTARVASGLAAISAEVPRSEAARVRPSIGAIVKEVAGYLDINEAKIYAVVKGRGRKNTPRKLAMYLAQEIGGYRLVDIARQFGLAHYGSASCAIQSMREELKISEEWTIISKNIINRFDPSYLDLTPLITSFANPLKKISLRQTRGDSVLDLINKAKTG